MSFSNKNWTLNSYTNGTWTDLVAEPATVAAIIISNPTASGVTGEIRLEDGGSNVASILPGTVIASNESQTIDIRSLNITGTQALQIKADAAGLEFTASGYVEA